jgi:hypothetical protein
MRAAILAGKIVPTEDFFSAEQASRTRAQNHFFKADDGRDCEYLDGWYE